MFNKNSGYIGYSMSVRAHDCYDDGIMPKSKWTKYDFINNINQIDFINDDDKKVLKSLSLAEMKRSLLKYDSWHHTSNKFNKTDFYKFDVDEVEDHKDDITAFVAAIKATSTNLKEETKKEVVNIEVAFIVYYDLEKNGRYFKRHDRFGVYPIKKGWFYFTNSKFEKTGKKKLLGNTIEKVRYFKSVADFKKYLKARSYSESDINALSNEFKSLNRNIKKLSKTL